MNRGQRSHWLVFTTLTHALLSAGLSTGCGARSLLIERRNSIDGGSSADSSIILVDRPSPVRPDVPTRLGGLGDVCTTPFSCVRGLFCPEDQNVNRICTTECLSDVDCRMGQFCVVNRRRENPTHGVCSNVTPGRLNVNDPCMQNFECGSNACIENRCRALCQQDNECSRGSRCLPDAAVGGLSLCEAPGASRPVVDEQVLFDGRIPGGMSHSGTFELPADIASMTMTVQDRTGRDLIASIDLLRVNNVELIDLPAFDPVVEPTVRYLPDFESSSALVPANDTLRIQSGRYSYSVSLHSDPPGMEDGTHEVSVILRTKRLATGTPATGTLSVRLVIAPGLSINATNAPNNARLRNAIAGLRRAYANIGVRVDVLETVDLTIPNAANFTILDSLEEMKQLFASMPGPRRDVVNLFFVGGLGMDAFNGAIGVAGGIVGPPGIHGTTHSGVVIDLESTVPPPGERDTLPLVMTHEIGHFLGLWHTQENLDPCMPGMVMDCSLWGGFDAISDTPNEAEGAQMNVMYWAANPGEERFSRGQGLVIRGNTVITH